MNPVLILTHNNLELTKRCVESVKAQDIETRIYVVDNGSSDSTEDWVFDEIHESRIYSLRLCKTNMGVSRGWNLELSMMFAEGKPHCLVLNNDTIIPPWFYRMLLDYDQPFVTGIAVDQMKTIEDPPPFPWPLDPHPDFSAFLIRREAWELVGPFDERMKLYASDCSWHVEAHRKGLRLWKACVPYYHERSSTLNKAPDFERAQIQEQADRDREVFRSLYGCLPGTQAYENLFK